MTRSKKTAIEMALEKEQPLRMVQLLTGQWMGQNGTLNFSLIGLDDSGRAWRYSQTFKGWTPYAMTQESE